MLRHHFRIRRHAKLRAHRSVRPHHAHHVRAGLISQSKMYLRPSDRLLLHQQARANFNFAAHAKRIDALVADCLLRVRPHHLPVIIFRTVIDGLQRLSIGGKTQQIEPAIAAQIRCVRNHRRSEPLSPNGCSSKTNLPFSSAKPNQCSGNFAARIRRRPSQKQIQRAIVIEIGDVQAHFAAEIIGNASSSSERAQSLRHPELCPSCSSEIRTIAPSACTASKSSTPSLSTSATLSAFTAENWQATAARGIAPAARCETHVNAQRHPLKQRQDFRRHQNPPKQTRAAR